MSKRQNLGGRTYVVDKIIELQGSGSYSKTLNSLKQTIGQQTNIKDINKLRSDIESAVSDGVISVKEKPGLKREWASLESTYYSLATKFSESETLQNNSVILTFGTMMEDLGAIMDKVFADMESDYIEDDIAQITSMFVACWQYASYCSELAETSDSITSRYVLEVRGGREFTKSLTLDCRVFFITSGYYTDITGSVPASSFEWGKLGDKTFSKTGNILNLTANDITGFPQTFTVTFSHTHTETGKDDVLIKKRVSVDIVAGTIMQWAWSDAETKEGLLLDPLVVWRDEKLEDNTKKYLWRRETSDVLLDDADKEWFYFRESGTDGLNGIDGWSRAILTLYKRSENAPDDFDGGVVTFTFSTNTLTGDIGTWSKTIPRGDDPLYVTYSTAFANTETDTIRIDEWTPPAILSENGTKGEDGMHVYSLTLYQRGQEEPEKPSGTVTYSFESKQVSGAGSWTIEIPSGTDPVWAIVATAASNTTGDTIEPDEWTMPVIVFEKGDKGDNAPEPIYQWCLSSSSKKIDEEQGAGRIFAFSGSMLRYYGSNLLTTYYTDWLTVLPAPTTDKPYIWQRISTDGGATWGVAACINPTVNKTLSIFVSSTSFTVDTAHYTDKEQTFNATAKKSGLAGSCLWTIYIGKDLLFKFDGQDFIKFTVPKSTKASSIEIICYCDGLSANARMYSTIVVERTPVKLSTVTVSELASIKTRDDGTELLAGDFRLATVNHEDDICHVPYRWNGTGWQVVSSTDSNHGDIVSSVLPDVLASDQTVPSTSAIFGFYQDLVTKSLFSDLISALYLYIRGAIYGGAYDKSGSLSSNGKGFHLSKDGKFQAVEAFLTDASVSGNFTNKYFRTVDAGNNVSSLSYTMPTPSKVDVALLNIAIFNAWAEELKESAATNFTYNGKTYTSIKGYLSKSINPVITWREMRTSDETNHGITYSSTAMFTDYSSEVPADSIFLPTDLDAAEHRYYIGYYYNIDRIPPAYKNRSLFSSSFYIGNQNLSIDQFVYEEVRNLTYLIDKIGNMIEFEGTVTIKALDDNTYTFTEGYIECTGERLRIYDTSGTVQLSVSCVRALSINVTFNLGKNGIEVVNVIPMENEGGDIGAAGKRFGNAFVRKIDTDTLYLGDYEIYVDSDGNLQARLI